MDISLTLCDKNHKGNVPVYEFKKVESGYRPENKAIELLEHWISKKELDKSVLVCFETFHDEEYTLLISQCKGDIMDFSDRNLLTGGEKIKYSVFEFDNYQDALKYCIDLKEGL